MGRGEVNAMTEPCCIAAAHGQACTCRRNDFWPVNMPRPKGDYHEGIEEGWKAGEAQERRIWEEAVRLSLGTIPEGLHNALVEVRKGIEGDD